MEWLAAQDFASSTNTWADQRSKTMGRDTVVAAHHHCLVPIHKWPICPIPVLRSKFYPRNIRYMPVVKVFARLRLDPIFRFLYGHYHNRSKPERPGLSRKSVNPRHPGSGGGHHAHHKNHATYRADKGRRDSSPSSFASMTPSSSTSRMARDSFGVWGRFRSRSISRIWPVIWPFSMPIAINCLPATVSSRGVNSIIFRISSPDQLIGRRGVQRRIAGVQSAVNEQINGGKWSVFFSLLAERADFPKQPPADVVVPAALNFDDNDDHRYHAHHKKSRLITQDLYMPWKNGHADSSDFNVLWQKAVSIFIYIKII